MLMCIEGRKCLLIIFNISLYLSIYFIITLSLSIYLSNYLYLTLSNLTEAGEYGSTVSFIIPVLNANHPDLYVIGHGRSIALVDWPESDPDSHSKKIKVVLEAVDGDSPTNRFNDAKCDPQGRLWAGKCVCVWVVGGVRGGGVCVRVCV